MDMIVLSLGARLCARAETSPESNYVQTLHTNRKKKKKKKDYFFTIGKKIVLKLFIMNYEGHCRHKKSDF